MTDTEETWYSDFVIGLLKHTPEKKWTYLDRYELNLEWLRQEYLKIGVGADSAANYLETVGKGSVNLETLRKLTDADALDGSWRIFRELCGRVLDGLKENQAKTLEKLNTALRNYVIRRGDKEEEDFRQPQFEITGVSSLELEINSLDPVRNEGKLVSLKGVLVMLSDPPETEFVAKGYQCLNCNHKFEAKNAKKCSNCGKEDIVFLKDDSMTKKRLFQEALLQEHVEDLARSAASIHIRFYGKEINRFLPGDRVQITGTLTLRKTPAKNKESFHFWVDTHSAMLEGERNEKLSDADLKAFREFSGKGDPLEELSKRFIPEIIGYPEVKKAMLLQAVSGHQKDYSSMSVRGRIHILLAGDPGKAKSQFLLANRLIEDKSMYLSDTSKAGLTVAVSMMGNKRVLMPGILVLANGGTACVDELDKMAKEDREGMHTAMEQGTISKSKAGLRGTFKANTSVLAAANPVYGRFDQNRDIPDQLKIESTLLDRFDLIFWFLEKEQTREEHVRMAIRALNPESSPDPEFTRKYIKHAKQVQVETTGEIAELMAETFVKLKEMSPNGVSIGIRSLHAIRRLSEASAKIRLARNVEAQDVETAINLITESLRPIGFDRDALTHVSGKTRKAIEYVHRYVRENKGCTLDDLMVAALKYEISQLDISDAVEMLKKEGQIFEPSLNRLEVVT